MKKTKWIVETEEKFVIPQIQYGFNDLIRGQAKFKRSEIVSPMHGSHVVDRIHYVDNSGKVNIDYGYDFVRDEKHISDEELIRRHGTKYHEFTFLNDQLTAEEKKGLDYSKKRNEEKAEQPEQTTILNSFFEQPEEIKTEEQLIPNEPVLPQDEQTEFKILLSDEEDETYEYNTFSADLPKPQQKTVPSFFHVEEEPLAKIEDLSYQKPKPFVMEEKQPKEVRTEETIPLKESPKSKYEGYAIPYASLFAKTDEALEELPAWLEEKKEIINQSLKAFSIDGEVITYTKGPAFTRYEIMLAQNVNVKKINSIYDNIQMALQAVSLRIQAPIPGKNTVGIEVPNDKADIVQFGDILTDEYIQSKKNLLVALGKNIDGTPVFQNIIDMPHALIAGATKSGKSVCINTLLVSLLIKNSPDQLKLILVDPKKVELAFYNNLPHLATPVIDDPMIATEALIWAADEMDRRYEILAAARARNIEEYNRRRQMRSDLENLPFIVIIVDEFNDLIMQCGVEANAAIIRLAQKARAAGIHLILATQRPTVNVVNGTIKANITCRIAFRVATDNDSRIILDEQGAESLLGRGDMLIKNNGLPERVQGAYISDEEISSICDYICDRYEPDFLFTHDDLKKKSKTMTASGGKDALQESEELLYQIAEYCVSSGTCSINSIQTSFGLGFNRASRIVTLLEERGIVSPKNGTKGREILVDSYQLKQMFDDIL
ncbi:MAG TPA: DNA translocase FtsK [Candidatus Pelethenecus faecipullorum]|uniref:DNA translocase FtsK n=1 Tax=Candidatus Pelethenecus faecipullorum TaxID=2840900 RepID=A0A9D1GT71_9MOLU|nr:DNA translocase FtsK [Candidatus Pelethenecus faecipullorum]